MEIEDFRATQFNTPSLAAGQFIVFCLAAADFSFPPKNSARPHTPQGRFRKRKARFGSMSKQPGNSAKCAHFVETTVQFCGEKARIPYISISKDAFG
jgi:hypothetical protein